MKKWTASVFFCLIAALSTAQSTVIDSLEQLLSKASHDTVRVNLLTDLSWEYAPVDPDRAEKRAKEALNLAQKIRFPSGEARAWNSLGIVEEERGQIERAIEYYRTALAIRQRENDLYGVAASYNNLGAAYETLQQYDSAIALHRKSLLIVEEGADKKRIARAHLNVAGVYESIGIYSEAYDHVNTARTLLEGVGEPLETARARTMMGHIRFELEMFDEAARHYQLALQLYRQIGDPAEIALSLQDLGNALDELGNTDKTRRDSIKAGLYYYQTALETYQSIDDSLGMAAVYNNLGDAYKHLGNYSLALEVLAKSLQIRRRLDDREGLMETCNTLGDVYYGLKNIPKALEFTQKYFEIAEEINDQKFIQKAYKDFSKLYAAQGDFAKAYEYRVKYDELRYERLSEKTATEFQRKEVLFSDLRQKAVVEKQKIEIERNRMTQNGLIGGAVALAVIAGLLFSQARTRARSNRALSLKNAAIERERKRADELLTNILPAAAAAELKANNRVQPVRYESVTVLFSDFKGFTRITEQVDPEDLIEELDECFRLFDSIAARFGLEKIKTIGDSYMCAAGLPTPNSTHAEDMVRAAIEMQRELQRLMIVKADEGKPVFSMRIGINTGPVVAGVVGSHKFAYDIWGDTVNTAARLEQGSEEHQINISSTTFEAVRHLFDCTFRGYIPAKNKGDIAMYFVHYDPIKG